jgi:hypothetical protein
MLYWDLVVAKLQVNLAKKLGSLELVKKVVNSGNWILIPDCDFFKVPVINAESPNLVFLLYEYNWALTG